MKNNFGIWARELRESKLYHAEPMSISQMTRRLGIHNIGDIEKGKVKPIPEEVLCKYRINFQLSTSELNEMYDLAALHNKEVALDIEKAILKNDMSFEIRRLLELDPTLGYTSEMLEGNDVKRLHTADFKINRQEGIFFFEIKRIIGKEKIIHLAEKLEMNITKVSRILKLETDPSEEFAERLIEIYCLNDEDTIFLYESIGKATAKLPFDLREMILRANSNHTLRQIFSLDNPEHVVNKLIEELEPEELEEPETLKLTVV